MKRRRSLTLDPKSSEDSSAPRRRLDGRGTPRGCLVAAVVTVALAVLPSPSQSWFAKPQTPAPQRGARRVPAGRLRGRGDRGCPNAFRAVHRSLSASLLVRHSVPGGWTVSGGYDRAGGVRKAVRSWRPVGRRTRPRGHWTGTRLADVPASSTGAGGHHGRLSMLAAAGLAEGSTRIAVLSDQGQDVQAA
jgi:hypothetical protein